MIRKYAYLGLLFFLSFLALATFALLRPSSAKATPPYYAKGDFNTWGTDDPLYDDGTHGDVTPADGIYTTVVTPTTAGRYEWKAADAAWTESWPSSNAWLVTSAANQPVLVTLDTNLHSDGWTPSQYIVNANDGVTTWTAVGDWQLWNNADPTTAMTPVGGGLYRFATVIQTAGVHQYKLVKSGSWDAVGQDGPGGGRSINSGNLDFTTSVNNELVVFWFNPATGRIKVQSYGALVINELDADQAGTDGAEFIEFYDGGVGNVALDGLVIVFYNGSNDLSYNAFDLDGSATDANGYFVLCGNAANVPNCDLDVTPNTDLIQNGQDAVALFINDAANFPNNTPVITANLVDALVYDTADADDPGLLVLLNPGQPQVDENAGGNGTGHSNQRCPNGTGGARNTTTYTQQLPTAGTLNCPPVLQISKNAPALVGVGDTIEYTIWVTNTGASSLASGIIITDQVPLSTTYAYGGVYGSGIVTFTPGTTLAFGESLSATFGVTVTASFGDIVVNDSYAVSADDAPTPVLGAPVATAISALDLIVSKTGDLVGFTGDNLLYTIHIENVGVTTATTVIVTDTLALSTTLVSANSNALTTTVVGGQVILEMGDLAPAALETIVLTVTVDGDVPSNTILTNTVTATTLTPGDNQTNNTATWDTTVYQIVPIATARAGVNGEVFAVEGQVIVTPGTYNPSSWALQDASGGIVAFLTSVPNVTRDEIVRLMATRGSFNNEEEFVDPVYYIESFGLGAPVVPSVYTTGDVASGLSEGWLTQIEGTISNLTGCSGTYDFTVDDGTGPAIIFVDSDTGVNVCAMGGTNGMTIRVTGFSSQFNADFELKPRDPNDIQLFLPIPALSKDAPAQVAPGELFTYTLTLQNFLGNALTGVVITDVIPANATFAYALDGGAETGGVVTWNVGTVPDQSSASVRFAVTATLSSPSIVTNETYAITASNFPTATFGSPVSTLVLGSIGPACGDPAVYIHDIQGSGPSSPAAGVDLAIEGVVVGDFQNPGGGYNGFFVQEEDADADANSATSEGLFVYDNTFGVAVQAGDVVRVFGTIVEFNGLTELSQITSVEVCASGASVTPASVTLPVPALDAWEAVEGMLLNIPHPLYVTEVFGLGRYGEVSLSVTDRLDQPTQVTDPGASALALQDLNDRSRVQLNDGATGQNPDPIIYPTPELSATNTLRGGDMVTDLTGVMNYAFGAYLIEPVGLIEFTHSNPRPVTPDPLDGTLKVVSFNVLNYFSTIDDGVNDICGPAGNLECRGADSEEEFTRQRDKIINAIIATNADIAGLLEIENNADDEAVDDLINGLNAVAGAGTYAKISTGTIGTDAIKVALIYKPASVSPVGNYAILDDSFDPNYHDDYNRPALAQTFVENATGASLTVVVNHLKSKGSACDAIGDPDTGDGQGNCNLTRLGAVEVMLDWLATDPTGREDPDFLLLGDFNSYAMEDPIAALEAGGFTNLHTLLGEDYYSYVFDGQWGTLDYGLASASLLSQIAEVTTWHINSDEPIVLDYNVEFKSTHHITSLYSPEPFRTSDHDPIVMGLNLTPLEASFTSNSPVTHGQLSVFTGTANQDGVSYAWDFGDGGTSTAVNPTHMYDADGTYTVTLEVANGFTTVTVTQSYVVLPVPPPTETKIYLPIVIRPEATSAVETTPQARLTFPGFFLAFVGMGGAMALRRKQ